MINGWVGADTVVCLMSFPMVSVIVPCYNYGHFLAETLNSLLAQTYLHWECLIIDDGSVDSTSQVAMGYVSSDPRFKYFHQRNLGLSGARNRGLEYASGRYIQFLDADDRLEPSKLDVQVSYLEREPEVDIVYGSVVYFGSPDVALDVSEISRRGADWMPKISGTGKDVLRVLVNGNIMVVNSPLIRSSIVSRVGYFNTQLRGHEDWEYWIRCALAGQRFHFLDKEETRAMVRIHACSMSQNPLPMLTSHVEVRSWMRDILGEIPLFKENDYRTALFLLRIAKYRMARGELLQMIGAVSLAMIRAQFRSDVVGAALSLVFSENAVERIKKISRKLRIIS